MAVRIVLGVQPHLQCLNVLVRVVFQLCVNEFAAGVPQGNQRTDARQRRGTGLHHSHFGIFAVVDNIVLYGIAEIADIRVSVQGAAFFLRVVLRFFQTVLSLQVGKGGVQLRFQRKPVFYGGTGGAQPVRTADHLHFAADLFRVVDEILVQRDAVCRLPDMDPRHILLQHGAALLQKQNVGGHLGARIGFEGRVGQAHRADQITARCQITAHLLALFVQRSGGRDERHHAAHAEFIHGFCQKIIVDLKMQFVIPSVADLILPERNIANGKVKETVGQVGFFVPCDLDSRFLVQLPGDTPRHAVQLNTVEFGVVGVELTVPMPEECPHAHTGFQHIAAHAADALQGAVHSMDNGGRGVKGSQGRFPCGGIFVLGQKGFQLFVLGVPVVLAGVKGICQTAPAEIPRQNVLLGFGGRRAALLDGFQGLNGGHIGGKLFFRTFGYRRFIGCQIVGQVILGRFRRSGQPLYVRHHFGHKGAFCRFALLNFVAIHFHQGVKFQRGQQVAVHGFQRGKGFLRVEGVIHQFADGAAFQIRADLNGVLLVLGGGVA